MAAESQALDRSKLEQKDRAELAAIVDAMGGKATSRAKKADLVDQILQLAGGGGNGNGAGEPPAAADARPTASKAKADTGPSLPEPEVRVPEGAGTAEEAPAEWELEFGAVEDLPADESAAKAATETAKVSPRQAAEGRGDGGSRNDRSRQGENRQGGQGENRQGENRQGENRQGENRQGENRQGENRQGDRNQGGQQGQGQQGQGGDDGEPGNRRRRRRGRDRNRDRDGQPVDRPGQGGPPEEFQGEPVDVEGFLDLRDEGYGFLRVKGYLPSKDDVYVAVKQVRQLSLRRGDYVKGAARPASRNEKNPALLRIDEVNGKDPETAKHRRRFEDLTPLFPDQKLKMELVDDPTNMTARIIDLISPIGKGQRGLIVSPPKAGKTTVMKQIARSIEVNSPDVHLIVLLVDERPEEVTDFKKWLDKGEVAASTFDRPSEEHTMVAELTMERAKRMVEDGRDVCIILDGITRLARAYNLAAPASGRIMSGGIDAGALYPPKKFFGAARNLEEGGSLTILATALVETNSRMDEHIYEEFKGTGNMEFKLDRRLAERRIYPAIDVDASSTRHEELLFPRGQLNAVWKLRRVLSGLASENGNAGPALELLTDRMKSFKTNDEFLAEVAKAPVGM